MTPDQTITDGAEPNSKLTAKMSVPGTIAQPCATFAAAYNAVAANGIIAALDPGKYGPLFIVSSVTINGNGWAAITGPAQGNAITIDGGNVTLNGLEIDGAGAGYNGIEFDFGDNLTVTNCIIQNFYTTGGADTGNGIKLLPLSGTFSFVVTNTTFSNNGYSGISYSAPEEGTATVNTVIDHIVVTNNGDGIYIDTLYDGGSATAAISNSVFSNNQNYGLVFRSGSDLLQISIDSISVTANKKGISANTSTKMLLGRSVVTNNSALGIDNETSPNTFYTYQNNQINFNGNSNAVNGSPLLVLPFQ